MHRLIVATLGAALSIAAAPAMATCVKAIPLLPPVPTSGPYADRVAALAARELWTNDTSLAPALRALVDEMRRDPAAPSEALSIAEAELSTAMDDRAAERLALAQAAEQRMVARGLAARASNVRILTLLAFHETSSNHPDVALSHAQAAIALSRATLPERSWEAGNANAAAGSASYALGRYSESLGFMEAAERLALTCLPDNDERVADRISAHATLLNANGQLEEAIATHFRAARWTTDHSDEIEPSTAIFALHNLGSVLIAAYRLREAEAVLRRAAALAARDPREANESIHAQVLNKLASAVDFEGRPDEAEALWLRAIDIFRLRDDRRHPTAWSDTVRRTAEAAEHRGDFALALTRRDEALRLLEQVDGKHPDVSLARLEKAGTLQLLGRDSEAVTLAAPAIATIRTIWGDDDPRRMSSEMRYASILAATGSPAAGYAVAQPVARRLERVMLDSAVSRGDLVNRGPILASTFGKFAALALALGQDQEAFRAVQLANLSQIVLSTSATAARATLTDPVARPLYERLQALIRERRGLDRQRALAIGASRADAVTDLQKRLDRIDGETHDLAATIDRTFPAIAGLGRPEPVSLAAFQASLGEHEVLLAPLPLAGQTIAIAVTRDRLVWQSTPVSRATVSRMVAQVRRSIDRARDHASGAASFDVAAAHALYRAVVPAAISSIVAAHRSIQYFAADALASIPPALFVTKAPSTGTRTAWLIRDHDITVLPALARSSVSPTKRAGDFLGVGAPLLAGIDDAGPNAPRYREMKIDAASLRDLPPLPSASGELHRLEAVLGGVGDVVLTGAAASKANVEKQQLDRFAVIAFATHGLDAGDLPGLNEPALVLTPGSVVGSGQDDGLLTASEIARLHLDADWIILSACNTAGGGERGAPAYAGLASAFVTAGARSLLVSHWPVRDDAAARLTVDTLREARTAPSRAVALQRAMLTLMADRHLPGASHPAVWAPFVLVGR